MIKNTCLLLSYLLKEPWTRVIIRTADAPPLPTSHLPTTALLVLVSKFRKTNKKQHAEPLTYKMIVFVATLHLKDWVRSQK